MMAEPVLPPMDPDYFNILSQVMPDSEEFLESQVGSDGYPDVSGGSPAAIYPTPPNSPVCQGLGDTLVDDETPEKKDIVLDPELIPTSQPEDPPQDGQQEVVGPFIGPMPATTTPTAKSKSKKATPRKVAKARAKAGANMPGSSRQAAWM